MNKILLYFALLIVCVGTANAINCYFCGNCPNPFYPSSAVSVAPSSTGYCAKKSRSSDYRVQATRGPAEPYLCSWSGCRWSADAGGPLFVCCCRGNLCNTGSMTSKSTIAVIIGTLALVVFNRLF
ncbi:unnamed protein product [Adineta ricciae]|uniref:Protein sleepless n=1 Tax=Adineta ricciae TaxID=249248 RepID=A0A814RGZ7_ADIRI|nr:unnamed protein product [Adineta ricciae]